MIIIDKRNNGDNISSP